MDNCMWYRRVNNPTFVIPLWNTFSYLYKKLVFSVPAAFYLPSVPELRYIILLYHMYFSLNWEFYHENFYFVTGSYTIHDNFRHGKKALESYMYADLLPLNASTDPWKAFVVWSLKFHNIMLLIKRKSGLQLRYSHIIRLISASIT